MRCAFPHRQHTPTSPEWEANLQITAINMMCINKRLWFSNSITCRGLLAEPGGLSPSCSGWMKMRPWGAPEVLGHVLPRCREKGPSEPSLAPEHPGSICSCRASQPGRWSSISSTQVTAETCEAPPVASPLHPALPRQTTDQQWPSTLPAGAGCGRDQDEGREAGNLCSNALIGRSPMAPPSPPSWGQYQLLTPLQPFLSFHSGKILPTVGLFFFLRYRADAGIKGAIYSKPCSSTSLSKYFPVCFPFPIKKENARRARLDTGRGNSGLLHHPRQIMPPVMQATHSHCQLHANNSVISPFLEHK